MFDQRFDAALHRRPRLAALSLMLACSCSVYEPHFVEETAGRTRDGGKSQTQEKTGKSTNAASALRDDAGLADSAAPAAASGDRSGAGRGGAGTAGHVMENAAGAAGAKMIDAAGSGSCVASEGRDCCPEDPNKREPGLCGCGVTDTDSDLDGKADCIDEAPRGWTRELIIDGAQVVADVTDFPLLVRISDEHLRDHVAIEGGSDIYFTAADQVTLLDFELESYAAASGTLVAWVHVPKLSAGQDAVLYLGYADGKTDRSQAAKVFTKYQHVWHLAQDPSLGEAAILDSTGRAHGTAQGEMPASARVAAVAGDGLSFDGMNDAVAFANSLTGRGPSTLSAWLRQQDDNGDNGSAVLSLGEGTDNSARFLLSVAEEERIKCGFYGNDVFAETVLPLDSWKQLAWVWNGTQSTLLVDGAIALGPLDHSSANTEGASGSIGGATFGYDFFMRGELDEVRVSANALDPAWITVEYNNQRPGSTFIKSVGSAQPAPEH